MAMMSVKTGVTKSWSDARQNEIVKPDNTQNISAADKSKLADENVGDTLNKLSDPNWVDPSKKMRAVGTDKLDKDAFMKLMLAQMKNQDPTNPMKNHELAAQLAQFSSVEQLTNMNTTLADIKNGQKPTESFQALNFIGKSVSGDSSKLVRAKGDKEHDFNFTLPEAAKEMTVRVRDSNGEVIRSVSLKDLKTGDNIFKWNGLDDKGSPAPAGEYQFFVEAANSAGKKLAVKTDFDGMITGVNYTPEGPVLLVGNQSIKLKDVKKIIDPSLNNKDLNLKNNVGQDLKSQQSAAQNVIEDTQKAKTENVKAGEAKSAPMSNLESSVGMSRGMMEKLATDIGGGNSGKTTAGAASVKPESKVAKTESEGESVKPPPPKPKML